VIGRPSDCAPDRPFGSRCHRAFAAPGPGAAATRPAVP